MIEEKSQFLECLNFQINKKDTHSAKLPTFEEQIKECSKSLKKIQSKFEGIQRRDTYKTIVDEFKDLLKKRKKE